MKRIFGCFILVTVIVFTTAGYLGLTVQGQEESAQTQLSKRIIYILNATAVEAKKWDDKPIAIRTHAQITDIVWNTNPDDAVEYLKAAWTATGGVTDPKRERSAVVNPSLRNSLRRDVLLVARKRAPELAARWLEEMVAESKAGERPERGAFDDRTARSTVLLQMANELVRENPQAATELLIESLRDGVSFSFQNVLVQLHQRDSGLADNVFRAALARLKSLGMSDPNELLILYAYLFTPNRVLGANTSDSRNQLQVAVGRSPVPVPPGRQNPLIAVEFLDLASDLLLFAPLPERGDSQNVARALVSTIGILSGEVSEKLPQKAALLQARALQLDSDARFSTAPLQPRSDMPETRPGESRESFTERRVDLMEELAAKGRDQLARDIGYATAAFATSVERYQRGLDLAGKIDDKTLREGVRSWLIYRGVLHAISADNFDEAYKLNLKNEDASQRAACLVVGAQKLAKAKQTDRASDWLREAGGLVKRSEPTEAVVHATLGIVSTFGLFNTQESLEWLLVAVKQMRKTSPASLNEDGAPRLKRINGITPGSDPTNGTVGFGLQSAISVFSPDQFEQVLAMINDITPEEARGVAVVTLCSNFLKKHPAPKRTSTASSVESAPKSVPH